MTRTINKDQAGRLLFQQKPHNQDIGDLHLDLDRHLLNKPSLRSKRIATNMMRTMYQLVITLKRDCQGWLRSEAREPITELSLGWRGAPCILCRMHRVIKCIQLFEPFGVACIAEQILHYCKILNMCKNHHIKHKEATLGRFLRCVSKISQ